MANVKEAKGRTEATKELAEGRLKELEAESTEKFNCEPDAIINKLEISEDFLKHLKSILSELKSD